MHLVRSDFRRRFRRCTCLIGGGVLAASLMTTGSAESGEAGSAVRPVSASVLPWLGLEFSPIDAPPIRVAARPAVVIDLNVPRPLPLAPPGVDDEDENQFLSSLPSIDARHAANKPTPPSNPELPNSPDPDTIADDLESGSEPEFPSFEPPRNRAELGNNASTLANEADRSFDGDLAVEREAESLIESENENEDNEITAGPSFEAPRNRPTRVPLEREESEEPDLAETDMESDSRFDEGEEEVDDQELAHHERHRMESQQQYDDTPSDSPSPRTVVSRPEPDPSILPEESERRDHVRVAASVSEQGRGHIQRAVSLASRGAMYSSRAEFIKALRLIAHSLDAESGSTRHSEALAAGLTALDEATAFQPRGSELPADMQLSQVIAAHKTPILKGAKTPATPLAAMQAYHGYAERQLALAAGHELVAADALFGLAKLQPSLRPNDSTWSARQGPLSMTYYQAALLVYPNHYMAANELGVMFARYGQLRDAKEVLQHAASTNPNLPEVWYNLAQVHQRLGETKLAQLAQREWETRSAKAAKPSQGSDGVAWVDSQTFQSGAESFATEPVPVAATRPARDIDADRDEAVQVAERLEAGETPKKRWTVWPFR